MAVQGEAVGDADFVGGSDRVRLDVDAAGRTGPFTVEVELWYQPIGYRWAHNLGSVPSAEADRLVRYDEALAPASGAVLARAGAVCPP